MPHPNRDKTGTLKTNLFNAPGQYSFFQAVRLLRLTMDEKSSMDDFLRDCLTVRPKLGLGFCNVDVDAIEDLSSEKGPHFELIATFLGLYGATSPLPIYYTEELIDEHLDGKSIQKDFLDIFNSTFFRLFYQCWSKYRLDVKLIDENNSQYFHRLYSLLGVTESSFREHLPESDELLYYLGLFMTNPRSAMGLKTLLSDFFSLPNVEIEECVERKVAIPDDQHCRIGSQACRLGEDSHLGTTINDRSGKIRISCGPLSAECLHALSPGTPKFDQFARLVKNYLDQPLMVDVKFLAEKDTTHTTVLGGSQWSHLGFNTWLFSGDHIDIEPFAEFDLHTAWA